jgi:hypothetical protein
MPLRKADNPKTRRKTPAELRKEIKPESLYRAKVAFSGDMEDEDSGEMIPIVVTPNEIYEGSHEYVQMWPQHFAPIVYSRQSQEQPVTPAGEGR